MPLGADAVLALSPPTYESRKIVDAEELKGDSIFHPTLFRYSQFKVQSSSANRGSCFFPT